MYPHVEHFSGYLCVLLKSLKLPQPRQCFLQDVLSPCEMQPNQMVYVFLEKAGAGHGGHADFPDHPFTKFQICPTKKLRQIKKRLNVQPRTTPFLIVRWDKISYTVSKYVGGKKDGNLWKEKDNAGRDKVI